jgi:hypothetical protein
VLPDSAFLEKPPYVPAAFGAIDTEFPESVFAVDAPPTRC